MYSLQYLKAIAYNRTNVEIVPLEYEMEANAKNWC